MSVRSVLRRAPRRLAAGLAAAATVLSAGVATVAGSAPAQADDAASAAGASGRIEISHDPAHQPAGWDTIPATETEAAAAGYTKDAASASDAGAYWSRWIEIVPVGAAPSVEGLTYWVRDDGDFAAPGDTLNVPLEISEVTNPTATYDVPNFTFGDDAEAGLTIPVTGGQNEVITSRQQYSRIYRTFLTLNPNAALPAGSEVYTVQSTKYSPQTGFRSIPQLRYITPVLARQAGLFTPTTANGTKVPNYEAAYSAFKKAYTQLTDPAVPDSDAAQLDSRLTVGQVRATMRVLVSGGQIDGESVTPQSDADQMGLTDQGGTAEGTPEGATPATVAGSWDRVTLADNRRTALVNAIGYAQAHYTTGMQASDIEHLTIDAGPNTQRVTRAITRMLLAYTEASTQAKIVEPLAGITPSSMTAEANDLGDKTIFTFRFQPSQASTITFNAPISLEGKISFTSTAKRTSSYQDTFALTATDTYTVTVSNDLSDRQRAALSNVTFSSEAFTHSSLYHTFMPKSDYARDAATGHWKVRQSVYVPAGTSGGDRASTPLAGTTTAAPLISFQDATSTNKLVLTVALSIANPPELATRVTANGVTSSLGGVDGAEQSRAAVLYPSDLTPASDSASGTVHYTVDLSDELRYRYLENDGRDYLVWSRVMRTTVGPDGTIDVDPTPVATKVTTINPTTMDDLTVDRVDFGAVPMAPGDAFVVYETITPTANVSNLEAAKAGREDPRFISEAGVIRHEAADDFAQTVQVLDPALDTAASVTYTDPGNRYRVVDVSGSAEGYDGASEDASVTLDRTDVAPDSKAGTPLSVYVSDTVYYREIAEGTQLSLKACLYKVVDGQVTGDPVAQATSKVFTAQSASYGADYGKQTVSLGQVGLEPGATYVIYTSVLDSEGTVLAAHEDPDAASQTIIVAPDPQSATTVMELPHAGVDGRVLGLLVGVPAAAGLLGLAAAATRRRQRRTA